MQNFNDCANIGSMRALFGSKLFWGFIAIFVLAGGIAIKMRNGADKTLDTYVVAKGDIRSEVSLSGRVKPITEMNLAFLSSGRVSWLGVKVGDRVNKGQALASLEHATLSAQLEQAKASLLIENSTFDSMKAGSRPEDVEIARIKLDNAKQTLANKEVLLRDAVSTTYIKSENAIYNYVDQFYNNPNSYNAQLSITVTSDYESKLESDRPIIEDVLRNWQAKVSVKQSVEVEASKARLALSSLREFSSLLARAVNALTPSATLSATTLAGYKTDVSTVRNTLETELANVTNAIQVWVDSRSNSVLLEEQYNLTKAPARREDLVAEEARVARAEAEVSRLQSEIYRASIFAPVSGLIAKQDFEVGEIAGPTDVKIRVISDRALSIEVNVAEADVVAVKLGQEVEVTTDAYPNNVVFKAIVTELDPAETIVDGVSTYKTRISFTDEDGRLKPGMTANVIIVTASKQDALVVPSRFIVDRNDKQGVYVEKSSGTSEYKVVETGLRGSDGNIEILFGV